MMVRCRPVTDGEITYLIRTMRDRVSSTVNKELNKSDCTLAFIVFSNNIRVSFSWTGQLGLSTFLGTKCCVVFRHIIIKPTHLGLTEDFSTS